MKKRIIIVAAFTTCLALWGAVWPQTEMIEEATRTAPNTRRKRPVPAQAVTDLQPGNTVYVEGLG